MIKFEGVDFDLPQLGATPQMGYADEYIEKTMISGRIRHIGKGKRFFANLTYGFLLDSDIAKLKQLLEKQRQQEYLNINIDTPYGVFNGKGILEVSFDQARFNYDEVSGKYIWTNWNISIKGAERIK